MPFFRPELNAAGLTEQQWRIIFKLLHHAQALQAPRSGATRTSTDQS